MKELKDIKDLKRFLFRFKELQKISRRLNSLSIKSCNFGLSDGQIKRETKLIKKADEIAQEFNLRAYHQGDPRGLSLYLLNELEYLKGSSCDYMQGIPVY